MTDPQPATAANMAAAFAAHFPADGITDPCRAGDHGECRFRACQCPHHRWPGVPAGPVVPAAALAPGTWIILAPGGRVQVTGVTGGRVRARRPDGRTATTTAASVLLAADQVTPPPND
jgi:hypothetical protein